MIRMNKFSTLYVLHVLIFQRVYLGFYLYISVFSFMGFFQHTNVEEFNEVGKIVNDSL